MNEIEKRPPPKSVDAMLEGSGSMTGISDWIEVTQAMIDQFADATHDHQFIHVDPVRARAETPFGGSIAHGFLSLSLLSALAMNALPPLQGAVMGINYGFDKVRFIAPVRSGSRIRGHFRLADFTERKPGEFMSRYEVNVEIEGSDKPALVADWLGLAIMAPNPGNSQS
ncbi:MAG: MaoC family dehydratase [Nitratireductor sp.]|nr:MaoC family dehydratase [Nitratireductor sp.]